MAFTAGRLGGRAAAAVPAGTIERAFRYALALAAFGAALLFRHAFREQLRVDVPYLQFYPAVIVAASPSGGTTVLIRLPLGSA